MAATVVLGVTLVALLAEVLLQPVAAPADRNQLEHFLLAAVFAAFVVNGVVLLRHRPRNPIGWILVGIGGSAVWTTPLATWGDHLLRTGRPLDGWALLGLWVNGWYWPLLLAAVTFYLPVLFPDGRLPSRRWRPVAWVVNTAVGGLVMMGMTAPQMQGLDTDVTYDNPIGIAWMPATEGAPVGDALFLAILVGLVAGIASLVVRFRRSHGAERQQVKWLLAAAALLVMLPLSEVLAPVLGVPEELRVLAFPIVVGCLPTAITVAVLRHRLWDIDRLVSRTVGYAVLVSLLGAHYLGGVLVLGAGARALTGESGDLVVALSTLGVAAAFQPLRAGVQRLADRRFNRARYDATKVVDEFGRSLRDEVSRDAVVGHLRQVSREAVRPASAHVLLIEGVEP